MNKNFINILSRLSNNSIKNYLNGKNIVNNHLLTYNFSNNNNND